MAKFIKIRDKIMKITANEIKMGQILEFDGGLCMVVKMPEHVKPGKGPAYVQLELRNIATGIKINTRVNSSDTVNKAFLDHKDYQFLYADGNVLVLMDQESFDQLEVNSSIIGDKLDFLSDGMVLKVTLYENEPISIELPQYVVCQIGETEPVLKGATATASYKTAILTNGVKIKVPQYITPGEKVKIKTEDSSFVERVKG